MKNTICKLKQTYVFKDRENPIYKWKQTYVFTNRHKKYNLKMKADTGVYE
jgi:hypothetical protein